ncbi:MAG: VOC family protein [Betaproteobacteria bacterium]
MTLPPDREAFADTSNPMGIEGVEYIEYRVGRPQALGQVLELMGFSPVARHRSREVLLYRQGDMNVIINAHAGEGTRAAPLPEVPAIAAIALRVRDAAAAHRRALDLGAWDVPVQVAPMELHIPAIHGVGSSRIYFVDRHPPAMAGLRWFGIVQYIGPQRSEDWIAFYRELFGFEELGDDRETGVLPTGRVLKSPDGSLQLQLIEPDPLVTDGTERLQRIALGAPDVPAAAAALKARGVHFVETQRLHVDVRGALTQSWLGGLMFELIHVDA